MKYFLIIISVLLLLSCDSSTSPSDESFTLSGKVSLFDAEGNPVTSGLEDIIIMIYNTVDIDQDLLQVKADYPHIGAEINQEVFFDIRDAEPIKTVNSNSTGEYSFSIAKGDYNLCYYKEDYGYKLIHELEVSSDQSLAEVVLNEVISLSGFISDFTFESGRVYHITDDLIIPANSNVYFETGTYINVANNKKIYVMDDFNIIKNQINDYIEVNSIFNNQTSRSIFRGFECVNGNSYHFESFLIKNTTTALSFNSVNASVNINKSTIIKSNIGISTVLVDTITIVNSNVLNTTSIGIDLNSSNLCNSNIVFGNYEGIRSVDTISLITNSYFMENHMGVRLGFYESIEIMNNEFSSNDIGISMSGASPIISYNNFKDDDININTCKRYVQGYDEFSNPSIKFNNFSSGECYIDLIGNDDLFSSSGIFTWGVHNDLVIRRNNCQKIDNFRDNLYYGYSEGYEILVEFPYNNTIIEAGIGNQNE